MVTMPVVSDVNCDCCGWVEDEYNPNDWLAFAPWNNRLLCMSCRRLMAEFDAEAAMEAEAEEEVAEIPVDVAEGVEDTDEIELAITVDSEGNVLSVSVIPHVPSTLDNAEDDVVDLTESSDDDSVSTASYSGSIGTPSRPIRGDSPSTPSFSAASRFAFSSSIYSRRSLTTLLVGLSLVYEDGICMLLFSASWSSRS
jgi:hypothetical protein